MKHGLAAGIAAGIALAALCASAARGWETTTAQLEQESRLTLRIATAHVNWAKPYACGRIRALYFAATKSEGMQTHAREIVELMQRFDLDVEAVYWYSFYGEYWFGGEAGKQRVARLMSQPRDVYIFQDIPPDDGDEQTALAAKNYPRWYDRQAFQRHNFVRHCTAHADAMHTLDPDTRVGFEGSGGFARSADVDLVCRELGFWVPYASSVDEVIRSIAPRDFIRANWTGYHWTADGLLAAYWRMVSNGCDSVWWWMWSAMGAWRGFQTPDLGAYPATEEMLRETQVVRDGLGDLLLRSTMLDDGIAMLYSMPSSFAVTLDNQKSYGDYEANHRAWYTVIQDMPMQFRYVTDRMMDRAEYWEQNIVTDNEVKTVTLPVAYNDPPGRYIINVTDILTTETEVRVVMTVR